MSASSATKISADVSLRIKSVLFWLSILTRLRGLLGLALTGDMRPDRTVPSPDHDIYS